jgi:sodium-dependent dicarboxylate transporter 2/3/5
MQKMDKNKAVKLIAVVASTLVVYSLTAHLEQGIRMTLTLLITSSALWVTEVIPLGITALIVALSQPLLNIQPLENALKPFFAPVIILLLGGFFLARAFAKHDLDEVLAYHIVTRLGDNIKILVLGLMVTTAFLSMWISNTASTALMITLALHLTVEEEQRDRQNFSKIAVLGIAYSATAGGLATIIGTAPNALAAGLLKEITGSSVTFIEWSLYALPITFLLVLIIWALLFKIFPIKGKTVQKITRERPKLTFKQKVTLAVFVGAVTLWVTGKIPEPLALLIRWEGHGVSAAMVAIIVSVALFITGLLNQSDIPLVDWNTLLLVGGGLSLGCALEVSKTTNWMAQNIITYVGDGSNVILIVAFGFATLLFSIVASNTASANIFIPIALSISLQTGISPTLFAIFIAICSSLDFMLPIGTPPNAIAYSTGKVKMRDMIKAGFLLDVISSLTTMLFALSFWQLLS